MSMDKRCEEVGTEVLGKIKTQMASQTNILSESIDFSQKVENAARIQNLLEKQKNQSRPLELKGRSI